MNATRKAKLSYDTSVYGRRKPEKRGRGHIPKPKIEEPKIEPIIEKPIEQPKTEPIIEKPIEQPKTEEPIGYTREELHKKKKAELRNICKKMGIEFTAHDAKDDLITKILEA